jgi:hypothetical protein
MGNGIFRRLLGRGKTIETKIDAGAGSRFGYSYSPPLGKGKYPTLWPIALLDGTIEEINIPEPFPYYVDHYGVEYQAHHFVMANGAFKQRAMLTIYFAKGLGGSDFGRFLERFMTKNAAWVWTYAVREPQ